MPPTQYRPSRRNWIKLWTHEWLTGTLRWQLTPEQRAMWADLLALAGDSRFPGMVTPGESGGKLIGYPAAYFAGLFRCSEDTVVKAFDIFEEQNRIKVCEDGAIQIVNWAKYQSEYQEKRMRKSYTQGYKQKSADVRPNVRQNSAAVESEVEVEGEVEVESKSLRAKPALKHTFPKDFCLDEEMKAFARKFSVGPGPTFEHFKDHHISKGSKFVDWKAAWRTWCRNARAYSRGKPNGNDSQYEYDQPQVNTAPCGICGHTGSWHTREVRQGRHPGHEFMVTP